MNYGVATADGGMLAHKGETMNETLTDAAIARIEARTKAITRHEPTDTLCGRDVPALIAALRASREALRDLIIHVESQAIGKGCRGDCGETAKARAALAKAAAAPSEGGKE